VGKDEAEARRDALTRDHMEGGLLMDGEGSVSCPSDARGGSAPPSSTSSGNPGEALSAVPEDRPGPRGAAGSFVVPREGGSFMIHREGGSLEVALVLLRRWHPLGPLYNPWGALKSVDGSSLRVGRAEDGAEAASIVERFSPRGADGGSENKTGRSAGCRSAGCRSAGCLADICMAQGT